MTRRELDDTAHVSHPVVPAASLVRLRQVCDHHTKVGNQTFLFGKSRFIPIRLQPPHVCQVAYIQRYYFVANPTFRPLACSELRKLPAGQGNEGTGSRPAGQARWGLRADLRTTPNHRSGSPMCGAARGRALLRREERGCSCVQYSRAMASGPSLIIRRKAERRQNCRVGNSALLPRSCGQRTPRRSSPGLQIAVTGRPSVGYRGNSSRLPS